MRYTSKTKKQLMDELAAMRQRIDELEKSKKSRKRVGEQLERGEEYFKTIIENSYDAIAILDRSGFLNYGGSSSGRVLGYSQEEQLGRNMLELVHEDDLPKASKLYDRLLNNPGETVRTDIRARHKDGSWRHIEIVGRNLLDNPVVAGIVANYRDITERKQAEEALLKSEENYKTLFESTIDGLVVIDAETMKVTYANKTALDIYGFDSIDELDVTDLFDYVHPDDREWSLKIIAEDMFEKDKRQVNEFRTITKKGEEKWISAVGTRIEYQGRVAGLCSFRDITESKRVEGALRASEEFNFSLLQNSPNPILVVGPDISIRYVNPSLEKLTGFTAAELIGATAPYPWWMEETVWRSGKDLSGYMRKGVGGYEELFLEECFQKKNGERFWVEITTTMVRRNGELQYFLSNWVDITERKQADEALREARDELETRVKQRTAELRRTNKELESEIAERKRMEEALSESEGNFRALAENSLDCITVLAGEGVHVYANKRVAELTGYSVAELSKKNFQEIVHPDDVEKIAERYKKRLEGKRAPSRYETVIVRKDGSNVPIEVAATRTVWQGEPAALVMYRDVTERKEAEEKLRRSEEYFRSLIEDAHDAIVVLGSDGTFSYESPSMARVLGYEPEERVGASGFEFVHPDDMAKAAKAFARLMKKPGSVVHTDLRAHHRDGSWRTIEVVGRNLIDNPAVGGIVANLRDITERTEAEEKLRRSEEYFRSLIENSMDGVAIMNADGSIRYLSPSFVRLLGYKPEERIGEYSLGIVHPDDMQEAVEAFASLVQKPGEIMNAEVRVQHKDGPWRRLEVVGNNLLNDPAVAGIVANFRDITERKEAEEALLASEEFSRAILETMTTGIYLLQDGRFAYINRRFEEISGYTRDELIGTYPLDYVHPEDREKVRTQAIKVLKGKSSLPYEFRFVRKNSENIWVLDWIASIMYEGQRSVLGTLTDITQRKEAEEALRKQHEELRFILDSVPAYIFFMDKEKRFIDVNKALADTSGIPREGWIGKTSSELFPEFVELYHSEDDEILASGQPKMNIVEPFETPEGMRWAQTDKVPIKDEKGDVVGIIASAVDITERREAEEALRASEERYRALVENANEAIVVARGDMLRFVNRKTMELTGYSEKELKSRPFTELIHEGDRQMVVERYRKRRKGEKVPQIYPFRIIHKDGNIRWAEINAVRITWDGEPATLNLLNDITERREAEELLKYSEERFRTLFENAAEGVAIINANGGVVHGSHAAERVIGYEAGELVGASVFDFIHPDDIQNVGNALKTLLENPEKYLTMEVRFRQKDGSWRWMEGTANNLLDNPRVNGIVVNYRNVTERKQAESILNQSKAITDSIDEALIMFDTEGATTFVNPAYEKLTGYKARELVGLGGEEVAKKTVAEHEVEKTLNAFARALQGEEIPKLTTFLRHKRGREIPVEFSVSFVRNEEDQIVHILAVITDITERKREEQALRESEEKFRSLVETTSDWVWEVDAHGVYTYASPKIKDLLGYNPRDVIGKTPFDFMTPDEAKRVRADFEDIMKSRRPFERLENTNIHKNGRLVVLETSATPVFDRDGKFCGYRGIDRDITERKKAEEALRASEERLRAIVENAQEAIVVLDRDGNIKFESPTYKGILGFTFRERVGQRGMDFVHPDDLPDAAVAFAELMGNPDTAVHAEVRAKNKEGEWRTLEVVGQNLLDNPAVGGIVANFRDITERKDAEEALRESEEHYSALVSNLTDAVFHIKGGVITWCNDRVEDIYGHSGEELLGKSVDFFFPSKDVLRGYISRVSEVMSKKGFYRGTDKFKRKDGSVVDIEYSLSQIPARDPIELIAVARDVTERRQMEENLRRSEERFRHLIENSSDVIVIIGGDGTIKYESPSIEHVLGYKPEELISQDGFSFAHPDDMPTVIDIFTRLIQNPDEPVSVVLRVRHKDGSWRIAEAAAQNLLDDSSVEGIVINFRDITERRQAEEERRKLEREAQVASRLATVGQMASGIAHEINNPLASVIGFSQLLLKRDIPEDIRHDVEIINNGSQRVSSIVKRLLTFAGQQRLERGFVNINDILTTTLALRAYQLELDNIDVITQLDPDLPWTVADSGQLQQVFLNLVMNAETEMRLAHSGGKLSIKTERDGDIIRISFKDDGPGIASENLERIFEPFFSTRDTGEGTGLGLSICHGIVAEHNGQIYAQSELGKGTTFIVELPLIARPGQLEPAEPDDSITGRAGRARILVVDDEPAVLQFMSKVLSEEGYEVETVDNANEALAMINSKRYSLILLDIKMPGMSGIELYESIGKIARSLTKRVLFITGDVLGADTEDFMKKAKAHYIPKPFDIEQLRKEIKRIIT
ncbi:MAG TPA: PAS domain S-box protein [Dehalococcoidia bacterium]|nr:PAS domain S-box protein [Dehalococcoidia bacterium]